MKIGKYISDLLFTHESVTLTGFGTFSTRYIPARFIPEKKIVESPSKIADFSPEPREGGRLLPEYIAKKEDRPVEQVAAYLDDVVKEIRYSLESGKKVEFENLGLFYMDADGNYQFEADRATNYLDQATDVPEVTAPAGIKTDPPKKEPAETGHQDEIPQPESQPDEPVITNQKNEEEMKEKKTRLPAALRWLAYVLIPLLIILILLFANYNFFFGDEGIFRRAERPVAEHPVEETIRPEAVPQEEEPVEDEVREEEPAVADPALEPPRPEPGRRVYYIVVGSFRNELMAKNLAEELRREGATLAHVLGRTPSNYHRVCYGYYYELGEAERQKAELSDELRQVAWILHR